MACSSCHRLHRFCEALPVLTGLLSLTTSPFIPYTTLACLTKLQSLTLHTPVLPRQSVTNDTLRQQQDPSVLSQLTGLTSLRISHTQFLEPPQLWEHQLASALTALTRLQRLELPGVPPGPLPNALAQLVSVTQLCIRRYALRTPVTLPGVQLLRLWSADLGVLASGLDAPQLRALVGTATTAGNSLCIPVYEPADAQQQVALVERCARGALRCCNRLLLTPFGDVEPETVAAVLQTLGSWWLPDPSLVDGSSPLIQASAGDGDAGVEDPVTAVAGWHLRLKGMPLSNAVKAAVPQGLTHVELW
jgi:hypothetical protein